MFKIREPVAAGTLYEIDKERLKKQIEFTFSYNLGPKTIKRENVFVGIAPHSEIFVSGPVAAWTFSRIPKKKFIIIGPNHLKLGSRNAILKEGIYKTPLGESIIDTKLAKKILEKNKLLEHDFIAHRNEHSIEMQLIFLQHIFKNDFKFVPLAIWNEFPDEIFLANCKNIGNNLASLAKKEDILILATSDFSSGLQEDVARENDNYIIDSILKLNIKEFFKRIIETKSNICGYGAIAIAMAAAKSYGVKKSELLKYATSAEMTKEIANVNGFASIIMY